MADIQSTVNSLLSRAGQMDPVLQTILQLMLDELDRIALVVDPAPEVATKITPPPVVIPDIVISFTYEITPRNVILRWIPATLDFQFYELRKGPDWDTATHLLVTNNTEVRLEPIAVGPGFVHNYKLKTISDEGVLSVDTAILAINLPSIGTINITGELAVNNVLLRWTQPTSSFEIDYYVILKNGIELTRQDGLFFAYAETIKGSYRYTIVAVDLAGNVGPDSSIVLDVSGFPDFALQASKESTFSGTKSSVKINALNNRLMVAIDLVETYQAHFTSRSWTTPQAQVNAGYIVWSSPFPTTSYYEEVFDFGLIFTNVIVSLSWKYELLYGAFTFGIDARVSDNGSTYSAPFTTQSFFVASLRYIKVRMNFTSSNDKALMSFYQYVVALSVRREQDAGIATADASDVNGTVVTFTKVFKDIDGITIAPMSTTTVIPIVEFLDVPNPTFFKVKIYDNAGVRKTVSFRWDARGVV